MLLPQLEGKSLLFGTTSSCGLGFMLFGYDQGVFGGLLANPNFLSTFNNPGTTLQGQIVSTYTIGCIFGALLSLVIGDMLGRRRSVALGCAFLTVGGILQATAYTLPHMIVGRVIGGLGIGVNTTTIPMWQSETCKPSLRGKLVAIQLTFLVFGFVLTNWMNFGFTYLPNNPVRDQWVSWRFPLGFQSALAIGTACMLPILAESPRWLCLKDRQQEAQVVLSRLVAKPIDDPEVKDLLHIMVTTIARERAEGEITWREVFHNGPQQTFRRILLGAGTSFMQQMGGVNVVAYYLPVVLERSFGFSPRVSLILSACDSMQWMFWAAMAYFVIERVGRYKLMLFGAAGCSMCFAVAAAGLGVGGNVANGVAVGFIFLYYFFYGLSWLAIPFLYPSEINSNRSRNRGASIAMVTNWLCVYIVVSITPVGIDTIGWKFYVIFAVLNLAWIPIVYFFYVETSGLSLEEIDRVFEIKHAPGPKITYTEAAKQAREDIETERLQAGEKGVKDNVESSDFVERMV